MWTGGIAGAEAVAHAPIHSPALAVPASCVLDVAGAAAIVVAGGFAVAATGSGVATGRTIAGPRPALVAARRGVAGTVAYPAALRHRDTCREESGATVAA